MKKLLLSLVGILCSMSMWADEFVISPDNMTGNAVVGTSDQPGYIAANNTWTGSNFTCEISGNRAKGLTKQNPNNGSGLKYGGTTYNCFKNSNGAQMTITAPTGREITQVRFIWTSNDDSKVSNLTEFAGQISNEYKATGTTKKEENNPDDVVRVLPTPANSVTFTFGNAQCFFLAIVTYRVQAQRYSVTANVATACTSMGVAEVSATEIVEGEKATFTATPNSGYKFVNWTSDAEGLNEVSTANPYQPTINAATTLYANFATAQQYALTYAAGSSDVSNIPASVNVYEGNNYTLPAKNQSFYKAGYTVTGWDVNGETKALGANVMVNSDLTVTPIFTPNTRALGDKATSVTWDFQTKNGCIPFGAEGSTKYLVSQANLGAETIDVLLTIDATSGKFDNRSYDDWAQINPGTILSIPSLPGTVVRVLSMGEPKNNEDVKSTLDGNEYSSYADLVATYATDNESGTSALTIMGGSWYRTLVVDYPILVSNIGEVVVNINNGSLASSTWTSSDGYFTVTGTSNYYQAKDSPMLGAHSKMNGDITITVPNGYIVKSVDVVGYRNKNSAGYTSTISFYDGDGNKEETKTLNSFISNTKESDIQSATHIYATHPGNTFKINVDGEVRAYIIINRQNTISAFADGEWASFYHAGATTIPSGLKAYKAQNTGSALQLTEIAGNVIPAQTAVLLRKVGAEQSYDLVAGETSATVSNNDLLGHMEAATVTAGSTYVLGYTPGDGVCFFNNATTTVGANKAYMNRSAGAKALRFTFNETTGINAVNGETSFNKAVKRIMNGQLVIEKAGKMFNAAGAQIK